MKGLVRIRVVVIATALLAGLLCSCAQSVTQTVDGDLPTDERMLRTCGEPGALHRDTPRFWALVAGCERVLGSIDLTFAPISSLAPLSSVREVEGSLHSSPGSRSAVG